VLSILCERVIESQSLQRWESQRKIGRIVQDLHKKERERERESSKENDKLRVNLWRAYVHILLFTKHQRVIRFVAMLDFYRHNIIMMYFYGIHEKFLLLFTRKINYASATSSEYHIMARSQPLKKKLVTINLFLTCQVPFEIICRFVIIWAFAQYLVQKRFSNIFANIDLTVVEFQVFYNKVVEITVTINRQLSKFFN